jgi:heterodisulfide reductase subunit B2
MSLNCTIHHTKSHTHGRAAITANVWLSTRETVEKLHEFDGLMAETNEALKEAGLNLKGTVKARHMVEILIEDIGFEGMKAPVVKPLEGMKIAGYVGCQTNRPFGIDGESFENPMYPRIQCIWTR